MEAHAHNRCLIFLFCILLISLYSQVLFAEDNYSNYDKWKNDTLVISGYSDFAPYESVNDKGEAEGYDVDLMRALMKVLGYNYRFDLSDLKSSMEKVKSSKADIIMGLSYSPERNNDFSFGLPIFYIGRLIISPSKSPIDNINQLKNKRIIVQNGGWTERFVRERNLTDKIIGEKTIDDMIDRLDAGEGDAVLAGDQAAFYTLKRKGMTGKFHYATLDVKPQTFTFAVKNGNEELLFRLDEGVQLLKKNGKYDEIYNKWFGDSDKERFHQVYMRVNVIVIILFLLVFAYVFHLWRASSRSKKRILLEDQKIQLALKAGNVSTFTYNKGTGVMLSVNNPILPRGSNKKDDLLNLISDDSRKQMEEALERLERNESDDEIVKFRMKDAGNKFDGLIYETHMASVKGIANESSLLLGTIKNITKEFNEQKELEDKRLQAEKASRLKSAFIANMSHDLRSPLNGIVGFTNILIGDGAEEISDEEKKQISQMVKMDVDVIMTLINDVLDMTKFESGTYTVSVTDANPDLLCKTVIESLRSKVPEGVRLVYSPDSKDITLRTDIVRTQQILANYLTNACKYTESGDIELRYVVNPNNVSFIVTDTGRGISKEDAEVCFDRFRMLENSVAGTGLGLHICKLIAGLLHGRVYVDTSYTGGARFVFEHPRSL